MSSQAVDKRRVESGPRTRSEPNPYNECAAAVELATLCRIPSFSPLTSAFFYAWNCCNVSFQVFSPSRYFPLHFFLPSSPGSELQCQRRDFNLGLTDENPVLTTMPHQIRLVKIVVFQFFGRACYLTQRD